MTVCGIQQGQSSAGTICELVAKGALDQYLTANAKLTYWKTRHMRYTNFAMESVVQPFHTTVAFGQTSQITLNRTGDLVYYLYVVIEIPGITASVAEPGSRVAGQFPHVDASVKDADNTVYANYLKEGEIPNSCNTAQMAECLLKGKQRWQREKYGTCEEACPAAMEPGPIVPGDASWACWANAIGQLLVKTACLVIGGSTIDSLYNDFLFMWEELTGKAGKRLTEMVGKRHSRQQLICDSHSSRILYVPLPFWFTKHSGNSLSLASLQFHGVQVQVEFERLENCIITSGPDVAVRNCSTHEPMKSQDLQAALETTYVYLDVAERQKFATMPFESLVVQLQQYHHTHNNTSTQINLNFNHPVIELIFAVRRAANERCNNWFDYSGIGRKDPVCKASLYLNNQPRFLHKPGQYLRMVQPYQHHTNIPDAFIYVYSFALHPEDPAPSGSCNMSRIDHVTLHLALQEGLQKEQFTLIVYALNYNVLRYKEGLGGMAFSS